MDALPNRIEMFYDPTGLQNVGAYRNFVMNRVVRKIFPDSFTCIGFHSFLRSRVPIDSRESVSSEDKISTYAFTYIQI